MLETHSALCGRQTMEWLERKKGNAHPRLSPFSLCRRALLARPLSSARHTVRSDAKRRLVAATMETAVAATSRVAAGAIHDMTMAGDENN